MNFDIYIPLRVVLSHPHDFKLETAFNGDIQTAAELLEVEDKTNINWSHVESELKPVLLCKFGAREIWYPVEVFDHDLYFIASGEFLSWLVHWMANHNYPYTID